MMSTKLVCNELLEILNPSCVLCFKDAALYLTTFSSVGFLRDDFQSFWFLSIQEGKIA